MATRPPARSPWQLPWKYLLSGAARAAAGGPRRFADVARETVGETSARHYRAAAGAAARAARARGRWEEPRWEELRAQAAELRDRTLGDLERYLLEFEKAASAAGTRVHWARDAAEANRIVADVVAAAGAGTVAQSSSATLRELGTSRALSDAGADVRETALADLVAQLGGGPPGGSDASASERVESSMLPAGGYGASAAPRAGSASARGGSDARAQGDETRILRGHEGSAAQAALLRGLPGAPPGLSADPAGLAGSAREYLRETLLTADVCLTGANLLVAETGSVVAAETEGNIRMGACLPRVLITVAGLDKVVATWADLALLLRLWSRSATGAALAPAVSTWTGVSEGDGPGEVHVVLVDAGRTGVLADRVGRQALRCLHCDACLSACPVFERAGARPYGSVYAGPIGAALTPQLRGTSQPREASLPFASTLCGACTDVCPVGIDIPEILLELRARVVDERRANPVPTPEGLAMRSVEWVMADERRFARAQSRGSRWGRLVARGGLIRRLPGLLGRWTEARDLPAPPAQPFRSWWRRR